MNQINHAKTEITVNKAGQYFLNKFYTKVNIRVIFNFGDDWAADTFWDRWATPQHLMLPCRKIAENHRGRYILVEFCLLDGSWISECLEKLCNVSTPHKERLYAANMYPTKVVTRRMEEVRGEKWNKKGSKVYNAYIWISHNIKITCTKKLANTDNNVKAFWGFLLLHRNLLKKKEKLKALCIQKLFDFQLQSLIF